MADCLDVPFERTFKISKFSATIFWSTSAVVETSHMASPNCEFSKLTVAIVGKFLHALLERSFGSSKCSANLFWATLAFVKTSPMASSNGEFSKLTVEIIG